MSLKIYAEIPSSTVFYASRLPVETTDAARTQLINDARAHARADRWSINGELVWSGRDDVPTLGAFVDVRMNGIGRAVVCGFFAEDGYLGVYVKPLNPPAWYVKQNGETPCHVFGAELTPQAELDTRALNTPTVTRRARVVR